MGRVQLEHVFKRFDTVTAVNDLNLDIRDEEFLVLVGPSGCGKTTALRMVAGLEETTAGDILIGNRRVNDLAPRDRDIAMVFQSYALYPHMSVYDNMAFGLKLHHVPKPDILRRVNDAAHILGIEQLLQRKPKQLSGGQRQRVALGRAIVREPQAFLMDEPLSNLDAKLRVETRAQIIKLHQRLRTTTIYVTHDQTEAMTMGDRIAVMRDGLLQQLDTTQGLYDRPTNVFVAEFIGSPAMNMLKMGVALEGGEVTVRHDTISLPVSASLGQVLSSYNGKEVLIGVRPEDIREERVPGLEMAPMNAQVDVVEPLGSEAYLYLLAGGTQFIARVGGRTAARPGESVQMWVNISHLHAFDPETEESLRNAPVAVPA
ncbi:MAG: ABC transporter ATP-binding protein [Dehalococcoidia bacterium]